MPISSPARFAYLLLRLGVAFAFVYPAISALSEPYTWLGYMPPFVLALAASLGVSDMVVLHLFGVLEVVVALWILSGWRIFWPALFASGLLLAIVALNWSEFPILFRDVSLAAMSFALALMNWPKANRALQ